MEMGKPFNVRDVTKDGYYWVADPDESSWELRWIELRRGLDQVAFVEIDAPVCRYESIRFYKRDDPDELEVGDLWVIGPVPVGYPKTPVPREGEVA